MASPAREIGLHLIESPQGSRRESLSLSHGVPTKATNSPKGTVLSIKDGSKSSKATAWSEVIASFNDPISIVEKEKEEENDIPETMSPWNEFDPDRASRMLSVIKSRMSEWTTKEKIWFYARNKLGRLLFSVIFGVIIGLYFRTALSPVTNRKSMYIRYFGDIFINGLKALGQPLVITSLMAGISSLDMHTSRKIATSTFAYFICTTLIATIEGIFWVTVIWPGQPDAKVKEITGLDEGPNLFIEPIFDVIRQMFPNDLLLTTHVTMMTRLETRIINKTDDEIFKDGINQTTKVEYVPVLKINRSPNLIGLVSCSIVYGIAVNLLGHKGHVLKDLIRSCSEVTLYMVNALLLVAPIGVFSLIAAQIATIDNLGSLASTYSLYIATVALSMITHGFIMLPLIYFVLARHNPFLYFKGVVEAVMTAFGTASSSATLPITMNNLKDNNKVDQRIISFVLPIGTTVNMDGGAIYCAVATIFICQYRDESIDLYKLLTIWLVSAAASVGAAGIPSVGGGPFGVAIILSALGLPSEDIGMILSLDWLADRMATVVNVLGDVYGAGVVERIAEKELTMSPMNTRSAGSQHGMFGEIIAKWGSVMTMTDVTTDKKTENDTKKYFSTAI